MEHHGAGDRNYIFIGVLRFVVVDNWDISVCILAKGVGA